jgi:hypothetical protein
MRAPSSLILQELPQSVAGIRLSRVGSAGMPLPHGKFEEFAEVRRPLFGHGFGAAFAALVRRAEIVVHAVEADMEIRATGIAGLAATRRAAKKIRSTALMTVAIWHQTRITV